MELLKLSMLGGWKKRSNLAEMYGLFQGLCIGKDKGITHIVILGDSLVLIQYLIKKISPRDNSLAQVLGRIKSLLDSF